MKLLDAVRSQAILLTRRRLSRLNQEAATDNFRAVSVRVEIAPEDPAEIASGPRRYHPIQK